MGSFRPRITPAVLTWARNSARLSPGDLAKVCRTTDEMISEWERGASTPTMAQLQDIAKRCKRPVAVFFLPAPPGESTTHPELRSLGSKGPDSFSSETAYALRVAQQCQEVSIDVFRELNELPHLKLPIFRKQDDPKVLGRRLREQLGVTLDEQRRWRKPDVALREWRARIEALGVITLQLKFPVPEGRGFSLFHAVAPIIVLNSNDAETARCFTLFHEIGHLCRRRSGVFHAGSLFGKLSTSERDDEIFCNRFAAEILVPTNDNVIMNWLAACVIDGEVQEASVLSVAKEMKVSRYVILRELWSSNMILLSTLQTVEKNWQDEFAGPPAKDDHKPIIPQHVQCLSRRGRRFVRVVFEGVDRDVITTMEASDYLGLKTKHFDKLRAGIDSNGL